MPFCFLIGNLFNAFTIYRTCFFQEPTIWNKPNDLSMEATARRACKAIKQNPETVELFLLKPQKRPYWDVELQPKVEDADTYWRMTSGGRMRIAAITNGQALKMPWETAVFVGDSHQNPLIKVPIVGCSFHVGNYKSLFYCL